jgi:hypothetical protein
LKANDAGIVLINTPKLSQVAPLWLFGLILAKSETNLLITLFSSQILTT